MLLSAKPYVEYKIKELKERLAKIDKTPKLAVLQVEGNPASDKYVSNKMKRCAEVGILADLYFYNKDVTSKELEEKIAELNNDKEVTGILIQLPLPEHLDEQFLINQICPYKDVDGLTWYNIGRLSQGSYAIPPCTPKGVIDLLDYYQIPLEGKDVLIINDSNLVGKPLAQLMLQRGATVTIAHKLTQDLDDKIMRADIVATAVGIPNFLSACDFMDDTIIIDIATTFHEGKLCGDVAKSSYDIISTHCHLTPVPGGIGQTTVMALLDTLVEMIELF